MRRTLLLLPALALVAPMLTSCGEGEADATTLIQTASAATADAGTAQLSYEGEVEGLPDDAPIDSFEMSGEGVIDFASGTGTLNIAYPDVPGIPEGTTMDSVFAGNVSYLRSQLFGELPDGAEWMRMDLEELLDEQAGVDLSQVQSGSSDPTSSLAMLEGVSEDGVEEVGAEDIDGVATTHYAAEIDLSEAYEDNDAVTDPEAFEQFISIFGDDDTITTDVWLDDDGRVIQQSYVQPFPIFGEGTDTTMRVTLGFHDFGDDVDIEIPSDDESIDYQDLLDQLGGD